MVSNDASRRAARSLLVLVRAAVEGEAVETMAEMQARVRSESSSGEGSAGTSGSGASGERVERPFEPFGLGAEGQTQAASLGVELASVLAGFGVAKATMAFPKSSRPGEETAAEIAARLSGVSPEETRVSVETRVSSSSLASPEDGDYPRQTAALESFARASRPPPGEALVCVSNDTRLLREAAQALTFSGGKEKDVRFRASETGFEHAKGAVFAYPENEAGPCELRRELSHE